MKLAARLRLSAFFLVGFCLNAPGAWASKDLSGRLGVGVANLGPGETPCVSVDWQTTRATAFEFNFGLNTSNDSNLLLLDARYSRNLFIEDQQYYFMYLGGGLLSQQVSGSNKSGYLVEAGAGAKFFLSGLPNLGLSFRGGFELKSAGGVVFQSAAHFGIHYYF